MSRATTMTVRASCALSDLVAITLGEDGAYENVSEYISDLIRRDKERAEREAFDRLKAERNRAFAAPGGSRIGTLEPLHDWCDSVVLIGGRFARGLIRGN